MLTRLAWLGLGLVLSLGVGCGDDSSSTASSGTGAAGAAGQGGAAGKGGTAGTGGAAGSSGAGGAKAAAIAGLTPMGDTPTFEYLMVHTIEASLSSEQHTAELPPFELKNLTSETVKALVSWKKKPEVALPIFSPARDDGGFVTIPPGQSLRITHLKYLPNLISKEAGEGDIVSDAELQIAAGTEQGVLPLKFVGKDVVYEVLDSEVSFTTSCTESCGAKVNVKNTTPFNLSLSIGGPTPRFPDDVVLCASGASSCCFSQSANFIAPGETAPLELTFTRDGVCGGTTELSFLSGAGRLIKAVKVTY